MVIHVYNPNTWEVVEKVLRISGQLGCIAIQRHSVISGEPVSKTQKQN
jgi:hypothetical protein